MVRHGHGQRHHGEAEGGERLHKAELHRSAGAEDDESGGGDAYNEEDYTEEAPPSREEAGLAITVPVPEEPTPARLCLSTFGDDKCLNVGLPAYWTLEKFQAEAKKVFEEYFVSRDVGGAVDAVAAPALSAAPHRNALRRQGRNERVEKAWQAREWEASQKRTQARVEKARQKARQKRTQAHLEEARQKRRQARGKEASQKRRQARVEQARL